MTTGHHEIAVLGTGRMGAPIARNLLAAGFGVAVWNRTPGRARELGAAGARLAASPADAARAADGGLTMVAGGRGRVGRRRPDDGRRRRRGGPRDDRSSRRALGAAPRVGVDPDGDRRR